MRVFHVKCLFKCDPPPLLLDTTVARHLYYIAREAVTNAVKHGEAKQISMGLDRGDARLTLRITNDGNSFSRADSESRGMGLHIMKYRAQVIGAALAIQAGEQGGCVVTCSMGQPKDTLIVNSSRHEN